MKYDPVFRTPGKESKSLVRTGQPSKYSSNPRANGSGASYMPSYVWLRRSAENTRTKLPSDETSGSYRKVGQPVSKSLGTHLRALATGLPCDPSPF